MAYIVCRRADGLIRAATRWDDLPHDPATEVKLVLSIDVPDRRAKRWDGDAGLRDATAQEQADFDTAGRQSVEQARLDGDMMLLALARWTAQKLGVAPATARSEILAIYRNLTG